MPELALDISVSLDGYVAGPRPTQEQPLGEGGMDLHEWVFRLRSWNEGHGREGGSDDTDSQLIAARVARAGATIMGRRMFSGGAGPWEQDSNASGWWGDDPPFHHDVYVLTHHEREPLTLSDTTFHFVTDGVESALTQARAAAGEKDITLAGGGETVQHFLAANLVDELHLHVVPVLLGSGSRLFGDLVVGPGRYEQVGVSPSPNGGVAHLRYRVVR